jgi:transcriptional regulator with XRE-family HTH domain
MNGTRLRTLRRKLLNWTQSQLAEALGVAANTVARYERDELKIPEPVARLTNRLVKEQGDRK